MVLEHDATNSKAVDPAWATQDYLMMLVSPFPLKLFCGSQQFCEKFTWTTDTQFGRADTLLRGLEFRVTLVEK